MPTIDRSVFFEHVRQKVFGGKLTQDQVNGMEAILDVFEQDYPEWDLRWVAYALATTAHETAMEMQPIEEYGKGSGMDYGKPDPETGQTYYGRGYVQLTWGSNYQRADDELGLSVDDGCYWHAENALDPTIAAEVMFQGMSAGWFRTHEDGDPETLGRYFSAHMDDPYGAREIINGDKHYKPDWAGGMQIGDIIAGYHDHFHTALSNAYVDVPYPPEPVPVPGEHVAVAIVTSPGVTVVVTINGEEVYAS